MCTTAPAAQLSLNEASVQASPRIAGLLRAGMLDWPGRVAATVFLSGCTLRCPYCHNPELVLRDRPSTSLAELVAHLRERRGWLDGVVVTGGEPTADAAGLFQLLEAVKLEGVPVKLDTNGTGPEVLASLISDGLVDFVALDVKAAPENYERATGVRHAWELVERSIEIVLTSGVDHEFRTTCYPLAVSPADLPRIASRLRGGRRYALQQFRPRKTLDPAAVSVRPHGSDTLRRAAERCSAYLPTVARGV